MSNHMSKRIDNLAIRLYNASLTTRGLPAVEDWASIHPDIRIEFEAIAKAARA